MRCHPDPSILHTIIIPKEASVRCHPELVEGSQRGPADSYLKMVKLVHNYYVYILECSDGLYYTGVTNGLNRRLQEHDAGLDPFCFTFKRRPVVLKFFEVATEVVQAIQREKQIKGWSRAKKEALFAEDFDWLKELAKCSKAKAERQEESSVGSPRCDPSTSSGQAPSTSSG